MTEQIDGNEMNGENTTGGFNVDRLQSNHSVICPCGIKHNYNAIRSCPSYIQITLRRIGNQ